MTHITDRLDDIELTTDINGNVHGAEEGTVSAEDIEEGMDVYLNTPDGYQRRTVAAVEEGILEGNVEIVLDDGTNMLSPRDFEGAAPQLAFVSDN